MASPALLQSTASSFHGQFLAVPTVHSARFPHGNPRNFSVKAASNVVLVEKSEAEKVHRLKITSLEKIVPSLKEEFNYTIIHQFGNPRAQKFCDQLSSNTASRAEPVKTQAKKAIATFKLREGQPIGIAVTLRGNLMYSFLDRLINLGLPRTRDFQGVNPNSFDGQGNFSVGIQEQGVFPEIRYDAVGKQRGMDVCITTTAKTDKKGHKLLALMGMPFKEGGVSTAEVCKKKLKSHHFGAKSKGRERR
ncbi:ribosomal L5P family protein [Actinidia rufa]|uniref:Large ribosomal subunit protein uL5c n=1 Tax=Actinidia rufa TaxID=165716 RepID=A0A7J0H1C1_9ERIC|nr:ribosomal L5P family protein [Actinidia rufa]